VLILKNKKTDRLYARGFHSTEKTAEIVLMCR